MTQTTTTAASFLEKLRNETSVAHKNLERIPSSAAILKPEVTISEYATYLKLMHGVVSDLETKIHPKISGIISDLGERKKASDLKADLEHIGFSASEKAKNPFGAAKETAAFSLGIAYVVEGSTLGGRFILKNIQSALGFDETRGASYFSGYGNKTGSMWKSFLEQMTDYASGTNCEDEIIAGANFAFDAIHKHMSA